MKDQKVKVRVLGADNKEAKLPEGYRIEIVRYDPKDIKLTPRLYSEALDKRMSFSQLLETLDPSERDASGNIIGLDAFERQLQRFGIVTRSIPEAGIYASLGERFFQSNTPESSVLFPEFVNRVARMAIFEPDVVDELVGERELTIKPLGRFLEGVRGLSGAAMLEDGTAIPLLHAGALVALAGRARVSVRSAPPESAERPRRILLVEDSLITRELERSLLTSLGLEVIEAGDGSEAMRKLAEDTFDMIISDVEMPRMNGFELTSRVKGDSRLSRIPVILVTTRGSPEDRHRGLQAGADAYVVKSDFNSRDFIETVQRFLT